MNIEKIARECGLYFNYCDKSGKPVSPPDDVVVKFANSIRNETIDDMCVFLEECYGPDCAEAIRKLKV